MVRSKSLSASETLGGPYPRFPAAELLFDPHNPRLKEHGVPPDASQPDILKALWTQMAVEEVAMSIAYNGYFDHEPLFIEKDRDGRLFVIEGNRRLAAVKLLLDADLRARLKATDLPDIDTIDPQRRTDLAALPGILTSRRDVWRYLGFKHVNGTATWGSYAKAQYIATVHNDYGVPLPDIANQIGDYTNNVERLYHGLMVVEQAESAGVFDRLNVARKRFEFSHVTEAIRREGVQRFLGLGRDSRTRKRPVPPGKVKNLGELLEWIYGDKAREIAPRMRTQAKDLDTLSRVLLEERGTKALRDGLSLEIAYERSLGDVNLFKRALGTAKHSVQDALGLMTTGFAPEDEEDLGLAVDIEQLATNLVDAMRARQRKHRRTVRDPHDDA